MIFSLMILVLFAAIVYFHYLQGLFTAALSAIVAAFAAILAVSYHETVALTLFGGRYPELLPGVALVAIFAVVYLVMRVALDKWVPGNVMFPLWVERIGAGAMGAVAACFATGTLAIAAQALPFGPSIAGYSRYAVQDRPDITIPGRNSYDKGVDGEISDEMTQDSFESNGASHLVLPVDDLTLAMVYSLSSDGGSLSGGAPLAYVHPDYLQELFAGRVGIQSGGKRVIVNTPTQPLVDVPLALKLESAAQVDSEVSPIRSRGLPAKLTPGEGQMLLVLRVSFDDLAAPDSDRKTRLGPASVRLVGVHEDDGRVSWRNYYPIGTLGFDGRVYANKVDDFLILDTGKTAADLVYMVDSADVVAPSDASGRTDIIKSGVFLEAKRYGRVELAMKRIETAYKPAKNVGVMYKRGIAPDPPAEPAQPRPGAPAGGKPQGQNSKQPKPPAR
jgi:hypothetical protein